MASGTRLAVDFGTSTTIAMVRWADGRIRPLLFDGSPLLSSAVLLGQDGRLHTGRDAAHLGRANPERLEPNPKRRIDDGLVLLGDTEVPVDELVATVLRRVVVEAWRVAGDLAAVTLTHPAGWGTARRSMLVEAAGRAGLGPIHLVSEPVAAATYFAQRDSAVNQVLVYDLGAGTCDVTLLRRVRDGFEVTAADGLNDIGGLDIDAAVVGYLQATFGSLWTDPGTRRQVWDEVRTAKEMLSRASSTVVAIPAAGQHSPLGREQLDGLARPVLRSTVTMTRALLREAGVSADQVGGVYLVGGSTRIPLVATLLHEALGVAPTVTEQPELVVAEGALLTMAAPDAPAPAVAPAVVSPAGDDTLTTPAVATRPRVRRRRRSRAPAVVAACLVVVLAAGLAVTGYWLIGRDKGGTGSGRLQSGSGPETTAAPKYDPDTLPAKLCDKVDLKGLRAAFNKEGVKNYENRSLSARFVNFVCYVDRRRDGATARIQFTLFAFRTVAEAVSYYNAVSDNLGVQSPGPESVGNFGDGARTVLRGDARDDDAFDAEYVFAGRDSNLYWHCELAVSRESTAWTSTELTQLRDQLVDAMRATAAAFTAGQSHGG
jgi:actin-like ATPase involved in cell morphogenesis